MISHLRYPFNICLWRYSLTHAQHWANFIKTADITDGTETADTTEEIISTKNPNYEPSPPYTLVHCHSQEEFGRTGEIAQQVKTEFKNATYAEMSMFVDRICEETDSRRTISNLFMVLDKKSEEDRKVVLIHKTSRTVYAMCDNARTDIDGPVYEGADDILWRRHRIPFEKAAFLWLLVMSQPGDEGDEFLQNTTYGTIDGL
jgi:hypothetical protein